MAGLTLRAGLTSANRFWQTGKALSSLCFSFAVFATAVRGQYSGANPKVSGAKMTVPTPYVQKLVFEPDGLEKGAKRYGAFVIVHFPEHILTGNFKQLAAASPLIVLGKITNLQSKLVNDGDDIQTQCTIHPERYLKGSKPGDVTFVLRGGVVHFPNGTFAEMRTGEWEFLKVGDRYVVILDKYNDPPMYVPMFGVEGMFHEARDTGMLEPLAAEDGGTNHYEALAGTQGLTFSSFVQLVRDVASAK